MFRRKIVLTGVALFALSVAFAAQSTSGRSERRTERVQQLSPWVPGANMLMSAHEASLGPLAPPR